MSKNLITPEFIASFVHLNKPQAAAPDAPEKYSLTIVLKQDDPAHMDFLDKATKAANKVAKEKWGKVPKGLKLPFRDGDETDRVEWEGCVTFSAASSSDHKPGVVDSDVQPIIDASEIYSGMLCRVSLRPYAWAHPTGGKGVSFGLANVQKTGEGDPLGGGGVKAEDEFGSWDEDGGDSF